AGPTEIRGGGSFQSDGSCNGGDARFAFTALGLVTDATANATVTAAVTETTTPTAPTGAGGTVSLQENAGLDKVAVVFGPHSGGFGPGRTLFNGFLDERPVTNVSSVDLRALPAAAPLFGNARKSPRVDLDNVRVRGAAPDELKGRVKFEDRALGIAFKTSQVTSLAITGNHVVVRGFATLEGPGTSAAPVAFRIDVDELGKKADLLSIALSNGYARSGAVVKGDFQLKPG
ncbi:MAG: Rossmann-fold NAD(P)-binding domain-containing protein, partial [Gaiellaceae bacterium]